MKFWDCILGIQRKSFILGCRTSTLFCTMFVTILEARFIKRALPCSIFKHRLKAMFAGTDVSANKKVGILLKQDSLSQSLSDGSAVLSAWPETRVGFSQRINIVMCEARLEIAK